MAFGIQIRNTAGSIQIDENYKNLALVAKSTIVTTVSGGGWSHVDLTISGVHPVLALRCTTAACYYYYVTNSGSSWTYRLFVNNATAGADTITYYVFDEPPAPVMSGFGMLVFNAAGEVTFDSRHKYLRVEDFVEHPHTEADLTFTAGRQYAAILSKPSIGLTTGGMAPPYPLIRFGMGWRAITNGMARRTVITATGSVSSPMSAAYPGAATIVDVTNY